MTTAENTLKLTDYKPTVDIDRNDVDWRCGNSRFSDDIWDFKGYVLDNPHWNEAKFRIDFTSFNQWDSIKLTVKKYILSELLANSFNSVKRKYAGFKQLRDFLSVSPHIETFYDFTDQVVKEYFEYLLQVNSVKGKPLSEMSIKKAAQVIKELLLRGATRNWHVPKKNLKITSIYDEMIIYNSRIREGTKFGKTKKVLPDADVIDNLLKTAREQMGKEETVLACASILLTSQLGIRLGEVLLLEEHCLRIIDGEYQIITDTSKTAKTLEERMKPANEIVVETIQVLEEYTKSLRKESGLPYLFLTRKQGTFGDIMIADESNWTKNRIRPFIKKNDLRDGKGNYLELTHHYFRHIFATYALKSGMKIHDVAEMMNHKSLLMTQTYDHTKGQKQEIIKDILSGEVAVTSTNKIVLESIEGEENPFKGLTTDQVDKMRRALKIELLPHGMCLHHPMRGEPCEQDGVCLGCHEFLASERHLPVYQSRLNKVNEELEKLNNDKSIYTTKLRFQQGMLEKYVTDLHNKMDSKKQ